MNKRLINKIICIFLVFSLMIPLASCGKTNSKESDTNNTKNQTNNEVEVDKNYSSLDDFQLWDKDGNLTTTGRDDTGKNAIVSSGKYEASKIGREIIKNGGNAVDAAVAVGFALGLTEPNACGPGGGGFMIIKSSDENKKPLFINFREKAPSHASPELWQTVKAKDDKGKEIDKVIGDQKSVGGKSSGIPGTVAGLTYALENYGTMSLEEVLKPTIELAKKGYTVTTSLSAHINEEYGTLSKYPEASDLYLKEDNGIKVPYEAGDVIKNEGYAKLLEVLAKEGKKGFYEGEVANTIVETVNKYGGVFTLEDMKNYEVETMEPIHFNYRGYDIYSSPSPSSGGTIIAEILNIIEKFDLKDVKFDSPERLHIFADAFSLAYSDRAKYMGDTKFVKVPVNGLVSKEYAAKQASKIKDKAINNPLPDDPWMFEHEDTTHFSVADKEGNMVATTFTINSFFGSKVAVPGYGILINNEMDDFDVGADHPNSIAGGKTPLSSMSPSLLFKDGKPFAAVGSPGGTTIISTIVQIISNLVDYDMTMQEAVDAPRIKGFKDATIQYENRFSEETIKALSDMGHICEPSDEFNKSFGSVNAVKYEKDILQGAGDPRRDGKALGY